MRPFRLLLVLMFLGAPAWAQPAGEPPVEVAEPPVEGGADPVEAQPAPDERPPEGPEAAVSGEASLEASPVVESPVVEQSPPVEEAQPLEAVPVVEDENLPTRRLRAISAGAAPQEADVVEMAPPPVPPGRAEALNEIALVAGWNAPSGWGGRYLRRIPDTPLAVGAGLAPLTLWGIKLSLIVRRAPDFQRGLFQQVSVGFSSGSDEEEEVLVDEAGSRSISLRKTPGRTLDVVVGYRWPVFTRSFTELFTGWSFNFQGTYLQNAEVSRVPLPQSLREELELRTPGGLVLGVTFGWRF